MGLVYGTSVIGSAGCSIGETVGIRLIEGETVGLAVSDAVGLAVGEAAGEVMGLVVGTANGGTFNEAVAHSLPWLQHRPHWQQHPRNDGSLVGIVVSYGQSILQHVVVVVFLALRVAIHTERAQRGITGALICWACFIGLHVFHFKWPSSYV